MRRCPSCGAEIVHATTPRGRSMPVNAEPDPRGNVVLHEEHGVLFGSVKAKGCVAYLQAQAAGKLYMPHHATCPQGPAWKRRAIRKAEEVRRG